MSDPWATVSDAWFESFHEYLDQKPGGRDAWSRLMFGSNVSLLFLLAAQITSDLPCALGEQRKRLKEFSKDLKECLPQVLEIADMITGLNRDVLDRGVDLKEFAGLPGQLRAYTKSIAQFAKLTAALSSGRLPKTADFYLFFLHSYLEGATGQPQWGGLATLLEAAHAGHGRCVEIDAECLRKKIVGMEAKHAQLCSHFARMAQQYLAAGNGNWWSKKELEQMAGDFAIRLFQEDYPEANWLE